MRTSAKVTLTIEIPVGSSWDHRCKIEQVQRQATDAALNKLRGAMRGTDYKLIGQPTVEAIIVRE